MQSTMDRQTCQRCKQRAIELGHCMDPGVLPELIELLQLPSSEIRRLAATAIGKLFELDTDSETAVAALAPVALRDSYPQVQQHALNALKNYGAAGEKYLDDLDELAVNPQIKDYVSVSAFTAAEAIRKALDLAAENKITRCGRCNGKVAKDEEDRSQQVFQRAYCDKCFDEVFFQHRKRETQIQLKKTIQADNGSVAQSDGERLVAEELAALDIPFRYDNRFRVFNGYSVRPDFYLPEFDLYIEYWNMEDDLNYCIGMLEKKKLYQQAGKKLLTLYSRDKPNLRAKLREGLARQNPNLINS